jgi:hypothetical protein
MPKLSLWSNTKKLDYKFIDRICGEHLYAGGTGVIVHKLLGTYDSEVADETYIQDVLFLENRDRKYDSTVYELRGRYDIQDDAAFDLTQFGAFLNAGQLYVTFHIESMLQAMGRKLMAGDVIELPHLRDDSLLGTTDAINRFFVVTDGTRPREGYDPSWWAHLWRVKLGNITDSQEYRDILGTGENDDDLRNSVSTYIQDLAINDRILEEAEAEVSRDPQYRKTGHLYFDEASASSLDGTPPNGIIPIGSGSQFPTVDVNDGDYFLRTDFIPNRLFRKDGSRWVRVGDDLTQPWAAGDRGITGFINEQGNTTNTDGSVTSTRVNLSQVIKPRTD